MLGLLEDLHRSVRKGKRFDCKRLCTYSPLVLLVVLLAEIPVVHASSLGLLGSSQVDIGECETFRLNYSASEPASKLQASLSLPEGLHYAGNSMILFGHTVRSFEPVIAENSLVWDASSALKSCREVVINELEQNPAGADTGKEWIELYNPGRQPADVGGWMLVESHSGKAAYLPENATISADGYYVLVWKNSSLVNTYPISISLLDRKGIEVDRTPGVKDEENDAQSWARSPNGKDSNDDLDWSFQEATMGSHNGGNPADIYAGESFGMRFDLRAGCNATSAASLFADMTSTAGKTDAGPVPIVTNRADLRVLASPDRYDVALGEVITWTVLISNNGTGTAHEVHANATLGPGLEPLAADSTGSRLDYGYALLEPGGSEEFQLSARVVSSADRYICSIDAWWGEGPCQKVHLVSQLGQRTSIRKQPDEPIRLVIGQQVEYSISAELPRGAEDLWINDTIASGLAFSRDSLSIRGPLPEREVMIVNGDGSVQACWFFGDVGASRSIDIAYCCTLANTPENQDGVVLEAGRASMRWMEEQSLRFDGDEAGSITVIEPDLVLEKAASAAIIGVDDGLSYTLALYHSPQSHATAFDVDLRDVLPSGVELRESSAEVLEGPQPIFDASGLQWHFEVVDPGWNSSHKILIRLNVTCRSHPGETIENDAFLNWTSLAEPRVGERNGDSGINDYSRKASARTSTLSLSLKKEADPDPVDAGGLLSYILTYEIEGGGVATNVTIRDVLDPRVFFVSANPSPANPENSTWLIPRLAPDGPHSINIRVRVSELLEDGAWLANRFIIESDELAPRSQTIYTCVSNGTKLALNKTALQKTALRGEEISFVIEVCNRGGRPATNVTVRDVFDLSVELLFASPPMSGDGLWRLGSMAPGECRRLLLAVRVPRTDVRYEGREQISGEGFVNTRQDYTTAKPSAALTNHAYVTSDQMQITAQASVKILGEEGTDLRIRRHGSGDYTAGQNLSFLYSNKSLKCTQSLSATHHATTFRLPGNGSGSFSSPWSQDSRARNSITDLSFEELVMYASRLDQERSIDLDKNGSQLDIESDFHGLARVKTAKAATGFPGIPGSFAASEEYLGGFKVREEILDQGQGLVQDRLASGSGLLVAGTRIGNVQGSHQSGTGDIRAEEKIDTQSHFISKDIDAMYDSAEYNVTPLTTLNLSMRWAEGMWSRGPCGFIGEELSSCQWLQRSAVARGTGEMESESAFSGKAEMRTAYDKNGSLQAEHDDVFLGDFQIRRRTMISSVSRYDEPHVRLDVNVWLNRDVATYTINITNDGNAALGPLFLRDFFPSRARFIKSSLRPRQIDQNGSFWTLLHLSIGDSVRVSLDLDVGRSEDDIINRVEVVGNCSAGQASACNQSIIEQAWLGGLGAVQGESTGCACTDAASLEMEHFDLVSAKWDDDDECPQSCPLADGVCGPVKDK